ncbi:hypothetical protein D9M73_205120 [compost metagenome]
MVNLVAVEVACVVAHAGGDVPGVAELVVVLQAELVGGRILGAVHLEGGGPGRPGAHLVVVVHGELMAVVDHVVVGDVFAVAGSLVFDFCGKPQAAVLAVTQLYPVGMNAVIFGERVPVVDAGGVCAGVERQAERTGGDEAAKCDVHAISFFVFVEDVMRRVSKVFEVVSAP